MICRIICGQESRFRQVLWITKTIFIVRLYSLFRYKHVNSRKSCSTGIVIEDDRGCVHPLDYFRNDISITMLRHGDRLCVNVTSV